MTVTAPGGVRHVSPLESVRIAMVQGRLESAIPLPMRERVGHVGRRDHDHGHPEVRREDAYGGEPGE